MGSQTVNKSSPVPSFLYKLNTFNYVVLYSNNTNTELC